MKKLIVDFNSFRKLLEEYDASLVCRTENGECYYRSYGGTYELYFHCTDYLHPAPGATYLPINYKINYELAKKLYDKSTKERVRGFAVFHATGT